MVWVLGISWLFIGVAAAGSAPVRVLRTASGVVRTASEEAAYARDLAAVDPALVTVFNQATADMDTDRRDAARAGFEKILARVPEHAPTLRRLSYVVGASGDATRALELARHALRVTPGHEGQFAVAEALLRKRDPASLQEEGELAEDLMRGDTQETEALMVVQIAIARQDISLTGRALAVLERRAPTSLGTYYFARSTRPLVMSPTGRNRCWTRRWLPGYRSQRPSASAPPPGSTAPGDFAPPGMPA